MPIRLLAPVAVAVLYVLAAGAAAAQAAGADDKDPEQYKGKVRPEIMLDEATGRITYLLRNVSDQPVKLHLRSLEGLEVAFRIAPDVDLAKVALDPADFVDPVAHAALPVGIKPKYVKAGSDTPKEGDRVVELEKDEAIARTFLLGETPWLNDLVKALEAKKFKAYRIDPSAFIYTADADGKPVRDHLAGSWDFEEGADGARKTVYHSGGIVMDLAKAKKLQALFQAQGKK